MLLFLLRWVARQGSPLTRRTRTPAGRTPKEGRRRGSRPSGGPRPAAARRCQCSRRPRKYARQQPRAARRRPSDRYPAGRRREPLLRPRRRRLAHRRGQRGRGASWLLPTGHPSSRRRRRDRQWQQQRPPLGGAHGSPPAWQSRAPKSQSTESRGGPPRAGTGRRRRLRTSRAGDEKAMPPSCNNIGVLFWREVPLFPGVLLRKEGSPFPDGEKYSIVSPASPCRASTKYYNMMGRGCPGANTTFVLAAALGVRGAMNR
ncbi:unnamed protein product, partial [Ectocarpus sp. 8 AP-2014]